MSDSEKRDRAWRARRNAVICQRYREHALDHGKTAMEIVDGLCHDYGLCRTSIYAILKRGGVKLRRSWA